MFGLGTPEILVIAVVLVLLFGAKKIPELMRGLGSGIKEFKKSSTLDDDNERNSNKNTSSDKTGFNQFEDKK
jgi:sec-independent protein translocase protein TatA